MYALSHVLDLVSSVSLFRKRPKLATGTDRSTRMMGRPARLVVPTLLVLMFGGCDGELIRVGFHEAETIIGEGIITYETILTLQPPASGVFVDVLDLVSTSDPTVWAVLTREGSEHDDESTSAFAPPILSAGDAAFLRLVDIDTGVVLSSQLFRSDIFGCAIPWPVDIDGDDLFEGLCRGGDCFCDVGLVDADGNTVWSFDSGGFIDEALNISAGDIDGDGDLEYCVGFSGSLGCFDEKGRTLWRVTNGGLHLQVKVVNLGTTATRVVALRVPRFSASLFDYLDVRNGSGELLTSQPVPFGFWWDFDIVQWPPHQEEPSLVTQVRSSIEFRSLDGQRTLKYPIPDALVELDTFALGFGVMDAGAEQYLVVNFAAEYVRTAFTESGPPVRSALVLYNSVGEVVFFDVLDDLVALRSGPLPGTVLVLKGSSVLALMPGDVNIDLFSLEAGTAPAPEEKDTPKSRRSGFARRSVSQVR